MMASGLSLSPSPDPRSRGEAVNYAFTGFILFSVVFVVDDFVTGSDRNLSSRRSTRGQGQISSSSPLLLPSRCSPRVREDVTGRLQRGKRPHSLPRDKEEPLTIKPTNRFIDVTSQPPSVIDQSIGHSGQDGRHFAKINDRDQMIIISGWIRSFRSFACTPQHCLPDTLRYYETIHVF